MGPNPEQPRAHILDLPDEVMVQIFSHLTPQELHKSVAAVCTRWERVAYYPYLWRNLCVRTEDLACTADATEDCNEDDPRKCNSFLDAFRATTTRLDSLTCMTPDKVVTEKIIKEFKPINKQLKHLEVLTAPVEPSVLKDEISHSSLLSLSVNGATFQRLDPFPDFTNLRSLHVEGCSAHREMMDPAARQYLSNLEHLANTCSNLEEFTLMGSPIYPHIFTALLNTTKGRLKTLAFTISVYFDSFWITEIERSVCSSLEKLVVDTVCIDYYFVRRDNLLGWRNLYNLKYLEFGARGEVHWEHSSLNKLFHASTFLNLEELIITNVSEKGDALLYSITRNFHDLKRLRICGWSGVTESGIAHLLLQSKNLQTLELISLDTELTVETFLTIPESLQYMSVHFCDSIAHDKITEIASRHPRLNIDYKEDPLLCLKDFLA